MTNAPVHIESLKRLGYTEREAEFLHLVAVHSGFFFQRQFSQYLGIAGRRGQALRDLQHLRIRPEVQAESIDRKDRIGPGQY